MVVARAPDTTNRSRGKRRKSQPNEPGSSACHSCYCSRRRRVAAANVGTRTGAVYWRIDVAGGRAMRKLTSHPNVELSPSYSPDGSRLAYWYPVDGDFTAENTVRIVAGGAERALAPAFDRNVAGAQWFADGKHLLICAADGTQNRLWTADLSGAMQPLDLGSLHAVCDPYSSSTFDAGIAGSIARG